MSTQIQSIDLSIGNAYFHLRPLAPSEKYLELYCKGFEDELHFRFSDWMRLTDFMFGNEIADSYVVPEDAPLDSYGELTLIVGFAQRDQEPAHLTYSMVNPLDPEDPLGKIYMTEGCCARLLQSIRCGELRRFDPSLADAVEPLREALTESGGLLGTVVAG
ncbi:hypothetical protein G3N58_31520 [Paraburkholderia sp. Ac-20342]|uniref:hypothetical protein n=1 Tax=Paraburkholderia sp. Ac-20342 TaxID=2703889 RepID=UPI00197E457B|nr:hypothetical protein [Paraburkholderia sp. Ac-20342]MBN3851317.1 hypothetical protein [Paraburkholderia sp. Ac-20342]